MLSAEGDNVASEERMVLLSAQLEHAATNTTDLLTSIAAVNR